MKGTNLKYQYKGRNKYRATTRRNNPLWVRFTHNPKEAIDFSNNTNLRKSYLICSTQEGNIFSIAAIRKEQEDNNFDREYKAFLSMSEELKENYKGKYIAVYEGKIVDFDTNESELIGRFFEKHGNVRVYIDKVGGEENIPKVRSPRRVA